MPSTNRDITSYYTYCYKKSLSDESVIYLTPGLALAGLGLSCVGCRYAVNAKYGYPDGQTKIEIPYMDEDQKPWINVEAFQIGLKDDMLPSLTMHALWIPNIFCSPSISLLSS